MSVKKTRKPKKTPARKPSRKKPTKKIKKSVKKDIKQAAENIPDMIREEMKETPRLQIINSTPPPKKPTLPHKNYDYHREQSKRRLIVWFGVALTTLVVFIMWFLNASTVIYDSTNREKPADETQILKEASQNLKEIFEATSKDLDLDEAKEKSDVEEEEEEEEEEEKTTNINSVKETLKELFTKISKTTSTTITEVSTSTAETTTTSTLIE